MRRTIRIKAENYDTKKINMPSASTKGKTMISRKRSDLRK